MTEFLANAILQRIRGQDLWIVKEDFDVILDDGRLIVVPAGFITDKASVPLGWIIKRDDKRIIDGALVHDYLYFTQQIDGEWIKRKEADQILIAICKWAGMGWFKRNAVYFGVRTGGWAFFNKRAKQIGNKYHG